MLFRRFETHLSTSAYLLDGYIWIFTLVLRNSPFWCDVHPVVSTTSWIVLIWNIRGLGMRSRWIRCIFPANYYSLPSNAHLWNRRGLSVRRSPGSIYSWIHGITSKFGVFSWCYTIKNQKNNEKNYHFCLIVSRNGWQSKSLYFGRKCSQRMSYF